MAKAKGNLAPSHTSIVKKTKQGGKIKTSSLNKSEKKSYKKYRGQGK